ncbi:MAG: hypothetical protein A2Z25_01235 [Planctomycetes bacterium RBG_16_55_9]|nr:MAG: hypothetical protein A2Z25_01235 [Planctomycetes bacterium RBG_16_55_9]
MMLSASSVRGADGVQVPDPSIMLPVAPAAAKAGAPSCIKPGTRLTYFGMTASIPGSYKQLVQDENGNWVDQNTGKRYGEQDIPSAASAAYNVIQVGSVGGGIVQLSTKLYLLDTSTNRCTFSMGGGMVGHAGCAADYWIGPDVLGQMQEVNAQGLKILRMPYTVAGKMYKAIRFQTEDATSYNARVYDLDTGLLIYYGSRVQGAPVYTPPIGGAGTTGLGQGSTQLVSGWIAEIKDIDVPWKNAAPPQWVGQFRQLSYTGMQTTVVPAAGSRLDRPMTTTLMPKARGREWVRFTNHIVIQSIQGMPPEQAQQESASGSASIGVLWIPPEALASLRPQQVIERHDLVGTTIAVSNAGQGFVTLSETGPLHRIDSTYDTRTGILSAITLTQQIGLATITHNLRLTARP